MKKNIFLLALFLLMISHLFCQNEDWSSVEKVFGKKGNLKGDVYKITFPRTDLIVTFDNHKLEPSLAQISWIAFKNTKMGTMIMGDLVLTDVEVSSVEKNLVENGIQITGIHNHIIGETPSIKYIHFCGMGETAALAQSMKDAISLTATPLISTQTGTNSSNIDWSKVENILGYEGNLNGNVIQFGIPRKEKILEMGIEIPSYMGMATTINMQPAGDEKVFATGDFVLISEEVNPVIKVLIKNGITVTAIHNHMLDESPRLFFLHYWGYDDAEKIAIGLKEALDKTNSMGENN